MEKTELHDLETSPNIESDVKPTQPKPVWSSATVKQQTWSEFAKEFVVYFGQLNCFTLFISLLVLVIVYTRSLLYTELALTSDPEYRVQRFS